MARSRRHGVIGEKLPPFDLRTQEFRSDPYPLFHRYRTAQPVSRGADGTWYLFRHADVAAFLKDERFRRAADPRSRASPSPEHRSFYEMIDRIMLFRDPPDHTRVRAILQKAFTPRSVESLRPRIQRLADGLLDRVAGNGRIELIRDFAYPLPFLVIAELLGVEEADRDLVQEWSDAIALGIDMHSSHADLSKADEATRSMADALRGLIERRRKRPREDLLSLMLEAESEHGELSQDELVANSIFLFIAGHMTSAHLIGNGVLALLHHPAQLEALVREPSLVSPAVEELLRFDSPLQFAIRTAAEDVELEGRWIRAGERVCGLLGSANRDPAAFPEPDRLDVRRPLIRHVGFGLGIHFCLGSSLARLEATVAFETLLRRLPGLELDAQSVERPPFLGMRGVAALPLRFSAS